MRPPYGDAGHVLAIPFDLANNTQPVLGPIGIIYSDRKKMVPFHKTFAVETCPSHNTMRRICMRLSADHGVKT